MVHPKNGAQNRRDRRNGVRIPAAATCWVARDSVTLMGRVTNLSTGGLFVLTPCAISRGTDVELSLKLGANVVEAVGEVAWCSGTDESHGTGLGIRFDRVMNGEEHLESFIKDLS